MKRGYIYKITNLLNDKIYIGKSIRCDDWHIKNYFGSGIVIQLALKKYGKDNFKKEILEFIEFEDESLLDERERYYISKYDSMNESIGYNRALGGEGGFGVKATNERRQKISKALKGKKKSRDAIEKMKRQQFSKVYHVNFENGTEIEEFGLFEDICKKYDVEPNEVRFNSIHGKFTDGLLFKDFEVKTKGWYNNGLVEICCEERPVGFNVGRLDRSTEEYKNYKLNEIKNNRIKGKSHWYNNGVDEVCTDICPEGFVVGALHNCCMIKGKHHYTNGTVNIMADKCPEGFWKGTSGNFHKTKGSTGMKWYNNGKEQKLCYERPEGWDNGKLKKHVNH